MEKYTFSTFYSFPLSVKLGLVKSVKLRIKFPLPYRKYSWSFQNWKCHQFYKKLLESEQCISLAFDLKVVHNSLFIQKGQLVHIGLRG